MSRHVAIIGNGIAGVTAARFLRKRTDARISVVSDETDYPYARTALMYLYMGHLRFHDVKLYEDSFYPRNDIRLVRDRVEEVHPERRRLSLRDGDAIDYDVLLIASGSRPRTLGVKGEELTGVQGLYGMNDLRRMEARTRDVDRAVVVGGGLIGIEMAEMLHSRQISVTFLVRETSYFDVVLPREESRLLNEVIREAGIDLRLETELAAVHGDGEGGVAAIRTKRDEVIPCGFVGIAVGVEPNVEFLEGSGVETDRGVLVDDRLRTSAPNVYAAGDCTQFRRDGIGHRPIDQLWYTARAEGRAAGRIISGSDEPYECGVFFNSAKFFNLEYQVYGRVDPKPEETQETLCWTDPDRRRSIRITFTEDDHRVLGFNLLGVRFRHTVCERWIREGRSLDYVLPRLSEANFDPEFADRHEDELARIYDRTYPERSVPEPRPEDSTGAGWLDGLFGT